MPKKKTQKKKKPIKKTQKKQNKVIVRKYKELLNKALLLMHGHSTGELTYEEQMRIILILKCGITKYIENN